MSSNTPNLGLLKKDPVADGNDTFNIETMLNDNWDKLDKAVGEMDVDIPDASLTVKGKVQLSNAINSSLEDRAATPKAVKTAYDWAEAALSVAATAQAKADAAETPTGAQTKVNNAVGQLSSLLTANKGNTVAAINELFTSVGNGKTAIAAAITDKGVPTAASDAFTVLAEKIKQISTGKKFASGVSTMDVSKPLTYTTSAGAKIMYYIEVSGLSFNPNTIVIDTPHQSVPAKYNTLTFIRGRSLEGAGYQLTLSSKDSAFSGDVYSIKLDGTIAYVIPGGFRLPVNYTGQGIMNCNWVAYE